MADARRSVGKMARDTEHAPPASGGHAPSSVPPGPTPPTGAAEKMTFLWNVHSYINEYIRLSDAKAGIVLTYCSALLGVFFSADLQRAFVARQPSQWGWCGAVCLAAFILLLAAALLAVSSVWPRLSRGNRPSLIFWDGILLHQGPPAFSKAFEDLSWSGLAQELAHHVYTLSSICSRKYKWVRLSMLAGSIGSLLIAAVFLFCRP